MGTTLTIGVLVEGMDTEMHPIHWYRVYKVRGQSEEKSLSFVKLSRGEKEINYVVLILSFPQIPFILKGVPFIL